MSTNQRLVRNKVTCDPITFDVVLEVFDNETNESLFKGNYEQTAEWSKGQHIKWVNDPNQLVDLL